MGDGHEKAAPLWMVALVCGGLIVVTGVMYLFTEAL